MQRRGCYFLLTLGLGMLVLGNGFSGPHPDASGCPEPEARQFDFWLGAWDIINQQRSPSRPTDPTWLPTGTFRTHVASILDGCAIVEQSAGELVYGPVSGFSLRAFDPDKQRWVVVNNWSVGGAPPSFSTWNGVFHHGRIEGFDSTQTASEEVWIDRSTFSDITDSTFRWDAATSTDGMLTWKPRWIMEGHQVEVDETTPPLPEVSPPCADAVRRAVAGLLGTWRGPVIHSADPTLPTDARATFEAHSIHGGCALYTLLAVVAKDTVFQQVSTRAPEAESGRWVQYSLDTQSRAFVRMEGAVRMGEAVWEGMDARPEHAARNRDVWTVPDTDQLILRWEIRASPNGRWQPRAELHLTRQP